MSLTNDELLALILENRTAIANLDGTGGGTGGTTTPSAIDSEWARISAFLVQYLQNNELYADIVDAATVNVQNAFAKYLEALNIVCTDLRADLIAVNALDANSVNALIATFIEAHAEELFADFIKATDIVVGTLSAQELFATVGQFLSIITKTVSASGVQAFIITSDHLSINDAFIKSAMIESITADKITSGTILTNNVTIKSADNAMVIADGTITISDDTRVRVQIGKDANEDYNMVVADVDGNIMFSALGISAAAIKSAIIIDSMISPEANISASKINIASLVTSLNANGGVKTNAANIIIDADNQTLSTWFQTMDTWKTAIGTRLNTQETNFTILQGQVDSILSDTTIETVQGGLEDLQDLVAEIQQTIDGVSSTVSSHTSTINTLTGTVTAQGTRVSEVEQTLAGITASVASNTTQITELGSRTTNLETRMSTGEDNIEVLQTKKIVDTTDYETTIQSLQTQINAVPGQITVQVQEELDERGMDPSDFVTHTEQNQYLTYDTAGLHLGSEGSAINMHLKNDKLSFTVSGNEVASWTSDEFHVPNIYVDVGKHARFGNFGFVPRGDGSLAFIKFGG